jgi:serine/threonine protein kinase
MNGALPIGQRRLNNSNMVSRFFWYICLIIGSGDIPFVARDWRKHNKYIKELIEGCLEIDPKKRLTPELALQSPWFEAY